MAELNYRFFREARLEFRSAALYYEQQRAGLGDAFGREVERAIGRICTNPTVGSLFAGDRVLRTRRFPYGVVYRVIDDAVVIVAVTHLHRRPGHWQERTSGD